MELEHKIYTKLLITTLFSLSKNVSVRVHIAYHEAIGKDLDAGIAKRRGGKLEIAEMATVDLGGHGDYIVEQVNHHGRSCEAEEGLEFDPGGASESMEVRKFSVG